MANYLLTYHGEGGMPVMDEERAAVMAKWGAWFGLARRGGRRPGNPTTRSQGDLARRLGHGRDDLPRPATRSSRADSLDSGGGSVPRAVRSSRPGRWWLVTETFDAM